MSMLQSDADVLPGSSLLVGALLLASAVYLAVVALQPRLFARTHGAARRAARPPHRTAAALLVLSADRQRLLVRRTAVRFARQFVFSFFFLFFRRQ